MSLKLSIKCKIAFLLSVLLIAGSLPLAVTSAPTKSASASIKTARDVAQQILAAYGGAEAFQKANDAPFSGKAKKVASTTMSGASNEFNLVVYGRGDKSRVECDVLGEHVIAGYDGKTRWSQFGDWVSKDTPTPAREAKDEIEHGLKLLLSATNPTTKLELLPAKQIIGKACDVLKVTPLGLQPGTVYADQQNHMILRTEYIGLDQEQGIMGLKAVDYLDYRPISGSLLPFKSIEYFDGNKRSETIIQEVDYNSTLDDAVFDMPKESGVSQVSVNPITVPIEFVGEHIIAKVRLNNKIEEKFIIDTGASRTVLDKSVAQKLGSNSSDKFSITASGKAIDVNYMVLKSFALNDVSLENISAMVYELSGLSLTPGPRIGGLIGANVLKRFLVTIDYRDRVMTLANPHSVAIPKGATVLPVTPVFSACVPVINGTIDGKVTTNFLVDTGAGFNNLPFELAKPLLSKPLMPVTQARGLDGQNVNMSAVRFKTLKLGNLVITDPVFAVAPPKVAASPSGLFTASALGILGNPTWRQFRITLDYANERLIIEPSGNKQVLDQHMQRFKQINNEYLKTKNFNLAIAQFTELVQAAKQSNDTTMEALACNRMGDCFTAAFVSTHDGSYATMATKQFQKAVDAARRSGDKPIEARVLASWADLFLKSQDSPQTLSNAQSLLAKASLMCPTESAPYAVMGTLLIKMGRGDMAAKAWDQALMLDPSNWISLWSKYDLAKKQNDAATMTLVATQLKQYYPDVPEVIALQKSSPAKPGTAKRIPTKKR